MASYLNILNCGNNRKDPVLRLVQDQRAIIFDALSKVSESVLPTDAMPIFDGWTDNEANPTSYNKNQLFWFPEVRDLLMTMPAWASNNYHQQGGGIAITPKHCLYTTHGASGWGLKVGYSVRWANVNTQQTFQTKVKAISPSLSPDANIFVLEDELPSWVPKASFLDLTRAECQNLQTTDLILISLSQGRVDPTHSGYSNFSKTPKNMMLYLTTIGNIRRKDKPVVDTVPGVASSQWPYRADQYRHGVVSGDSGMPAFFYVNGKLCVCDINTGSPYIASYLATEYNAAIAALDQQVGVNTGYQIDVVPLPYR